MAALAIDYKPGVLVEDITKLTNEEWLQMRRKGIGGSDCAAIMGVSPWRTAKELYWDKTGQKDVVQEEENWVAKEVGHRLEELVAQIFRKRTGFEPYVVRKMFFHPKYPWMLADIDAFVQLPNGKIYIVEIKTCSINALDKWGEKNSNTIPYHYELQGRHYMAVTNTDGVIFILLAGNTEDGFRMRTLERDMQIEEDIIEAEADFWNNYVLAGVEPPYTESADMVLEAIRKHYGDANGTQIALGREFLDPINEYLRVYEKKAALEKELKEIKGQLSDISIPIAEKLQGCNGSLAVSNEESYRVGYTTRNTLSIPSDRLPDLLLEYPEVYEKYVVSRTSQLFFCKRNKPKAAKAGKKK